MENERRSQARYWRILAAILIFGVAVPVSNLIVAVLYLGDGAWRAALGAGLSFAAVALIFDTIRSMTKEAVRATIDRPTVGIPRHPYRPVDHTAGVNLMRPVHRPTARRARPDNDAR